jgi:hypothetical protein
MGTAILITSSIVLVVVIIFDLRRVQVGQAREPQVEGLERLGFTMRGKDEPESPQRAIKRS